MEIKAAVVREKSGPFQIENVTLEEPRDDEVLVRTAGCGICHTDLVARAQYVPVPLPAVLGHEGSGVVEKVGAQVRKIAPGDHVVLSYVVCGTCPECVGGLPAHCLNFFPRNFSAARADGSTTLSGKGGAIHGPFFGQSSFASHILANEQSVVKVPKDVPVEMLGPLGCGIQTGAGGVFNALRPEAGASIAVFGAGSVGLSAVMAAAACGCTMVVAVDVNADRLKLARELGATHGIDASKSDPVEEIRKLTGPGIEYSLECTGIPKVLRQAADAIRIGGTCGLIGVAPFGVEVSLNMQDLLNARTVKGIVEGDGVADVFIPRLIELYRAGRFPFDRMVKYYPFDKINEAAKDSETGKTLKAVLRF